MSLDSISKDTSVHLIFPQPDGRRLWFNHTDRLQDAKTRQWRTSPIVGSEAHESRSMTLEMAIISQRRFRELGLECRLALGPNGSYIDPEPTATGDLPWQFQDYLVTVHADGGPATTYTDWTYEVRAVLTPQGKQFCLRFEHPDLQNQSVFVPFEAGPEAAVTKAREMHFLDIEKPKPNPHKAQHDADAQRQAKQEAHSTSGHLRPGDR